MKRIDTDNFQDYIDALLEGKESEEVEFKSARGGFPGSFWDTYSAFANTEGGTIVLGVKERNGVFEIDELTKEQILKYKKEFWDNVNNTNTVNYCLLSNDDVVEDDYKGMPILIFHIPLANRTDRPVYRTTNPYNGTFKRGHEGDYKCTQKEVNRMFADADDSVPADSRILSGFTLDDLDKESLKQYRQLFSISKPEHPWLALEDVELLTKLGGYRVDRKNKVSGFTLAGLLMFGKTECINDNECAPNYFVDYRSINDGEENDERWSDRIYPDGMWEANLFQFYRRTLPKLYALLPTPFKLSKDTRIDETPAHVSLREALVNTLLCKGLHKIAYVKFCIM